MNTATPMIFAEYNSHRRVLLMVESGISNLIIMGTLTEKFGGNWIRVQELQAWDAIQFDSPLKFEGFDNGPEGDYCGNIIKI